jgi:hypothetical protein
MPNSDFLCFDETPDPPFVLKQSVSFSSSPELRQKTQNTQPGSDAQTTLSDAFTLLKTDYRKVQKGPR